MSDEQDRQPTEPARTEATGNDQFVAERVHADRPSQTSDPEPTRQPWRPGEPLTAKIRETVFKRPGTREQVPATEATGANLSEVNATTVLMTQSGAEGITADRVTMERSGARAIDAKSVQMDQSGVVALSTESAVLLKSSAVQVVAEKARLSNSAALFVSSGEASIDNSRIAIFAGSTDGDVRALITAKTAAILAGVLGVFLVLLVALPRNRTRD
jgi:hypothetical protein